MRQCTFNLTLTNKSLLSLMTTTVTIPSITTFIFKYHRMINTSSSMYITWCNLTSTKTTSSLKTIQKYVTCTKIKFAKLISNSKSLISTSSINMTLISSLKEFTFIAFITTQSISDMANTISKLSKQLSITCFEASSSSLTTAIFATLPLTFTLMCSIFMIITSTFLIIKSINKLTLTIWSSSKSSILTLLLMTQIFTKSK